MSTDSDKDYKREAARVTLRRMLDGKKRGDRITAKEITEATGMDDWSSFREVIRRWARKSGFVAVAVRNDGYRLGGAFDHLDVSDKERRKGLRASIEEMRILAHTPQSELDESGVRRHQFQITRAQARFEQAASHERESRVELKLGSRDRVPLLRAVNGGK